jgi:hypothetical protein
MRTAFQKYPAGMVPVPVDGGLVQGTSFFPAGYGFHKETGEELPEWPEDKVMVVGNDWGRFIELSYRPRHWKRGILFDLARGIGSLTDRASTFDATRLLLHKRFHWAARARF